VKKIEEKIIITIDRETAFFFPLNPLLLQSTWACSKSLKSNAGLVAQFLLRSALAQARAHESFALLALPKPSQQLG